MIARGLCTFSLTLSLTLALAFGPAPTHAFAQDADGSAGVDRARAHFQRGVRLYEEEDFRAALVEFRRAYEITPNAVVLYNIGQSHYQLREYAGALAAFEKYIAEAGPSVPAERAQQIQREIAELRARVARVTIDASEPGADVFVDDAPIGKTPLAPQLISTGRHKVVATKDGRSSSTKLIDVAGGDSLVVALDLPKDVPTEPLAGVRVTQATGDHARPSRAPAYVALAIGGGGLVVGAAFGALALGEKSDLDGVCSSKRCPPSARPTGDSLSRDATISTIGFGVGIVGVGAGIYLLLTSRPSEVPPASAPARARVSPWVGPGAAGLEGVF